jgi:hypothetical protein
LLSPLRLDLARIGRTRRIARSLSGEVVVEATLVEALLAAGVRRDAFRPVYHRNSSSASATWKHLAVPNPDLEVAPATRFGDSLFATDEESRASRCPLGHVLGLNRLSEARIEKNSYRGEAIGASSTFVGHRLGYLRPERMLFVSQAVRRCLERERVTGIRLEIAHLV